MTTKKTKRDSGVKHAGTIQPEIVEAASAPTPEAVAPTARKKTASTKKQAEPVTPKRSEAPAAAKAAPPKGSRGTSAAQARERRRLEAERAARRLAARNQQHQATRKLIIAAVLVAVAFLGAYSFAASQGSARADGVAQSGQVGAIAAGAGASTAAATDQGGVQKISVDTSQGSFNPSAITAKAGVPIEITFSKSGGGCLSGVVFPQLNINEDLTGGPKTVKIPAT